MTFGDSKAEKRERKITSKEGSHSEPTNRRERRKHRKTYKKIKHQKIYKNSLYIRKESELK